MPAIGHHITLRLATDRPILLHAPERRAAARATLRLGEDSELLFFFYADTHAHLLVTEADRAAATELARRIEIALHRSLGVGPFEPARVRPIDNVWHLNNAVRYVLRQREHHGITSDPLCEASNLPDLLGLREIGAYTRTRMQTWLPRLTTAELAAHLPSTTNQAHAIAWEQLADAAAAAVALPSIDSKLPDAVAAKRAAVEVGSSLDTRRLAAVLHVTPRTVQRLRGRPMCPALVRAVQQQVVLRSIAVSVESTLELSTPNLSLPVAYNALSVATGR